MKKDGLKEYINGRSCTVLGLGVSNLPLVENLREWNFDVSVMDKKDVNELGEQALRLKAFGVDFSVADGDFNGIDGDVIFRSPGIRPDKKGIAEAVEKGAELTSEMELFLKLTPALTFGITGSDGKTTTTTLTGRFLEEQMRETQGKVYVGGNIGTPLLCKCGSMTEADRAVVELSSFQLMTVSASPRFAAITNVSPNHLDWHTGMDEYISAKKNIVGESTQRLVTNADCIATVKIASECNGVELVLFSSTKTASGVFELCPKCSTAITLSEGYITVTDKTGSRPALAVSDIQVLGRHNIENFMTAIGLTLGQVEESVYSKVATEFLGVEHRLEFVRELSGVRYYNSSIDSSPTRTAAALSALWDKSLVIICGGYDKNLDYAPLGEAICTHGGIRTVVLTGATGEKIGKAVREYAETHNLAGGVDTVYVKDFYDAVITAKQKAKEGECVVLTPASASFDAFKNFDERGKTFKRIVLDF